MTDWMHKLDDYFNPLCLWLLDHTIYVATTASFFFRSHLAKPLLTNASQNVLCTSRCDIQNFQDSLPEKRTVWAFPCWASEGADGGSMPGIR